MKAGKQPEGAAVDEFKASPSDMAMTPYWNPLLITGPDGKATISFELSDVAGTFRVTVDAQGDGRIGSGRAEIVSGKPSNSAPKPPEQPRGE